MHKGLSRRGNGTQIGDESYIALLIESDVLESIAERAVTIGNGLAFTRDDLETVAVGFEQGNVVVASETRGAQKCVESDLILIVERNLLAKTLLSTAQRRK
ncbi:MAG: hypothetical protein AAF916_03680 [Planctomycetota bacterium]